MEYFYNQRKDHAYHEQPTHPTGQTMATAALTMGIVAALTFWTAYLPLVLGGLGVIFAFLSQGFEKKMTSQAKTGLCFSLIAFFAGITLIIVSIVSLLNDPSTLLAYGRGLDQYAMQRYGQSAETMMGMSYEAMFQQWLDDVYRIFRIGP